MGYIKKGRCRFNWSVQHQNKIKAKIGYKKRSIKGGKPDSEADNILNRDFDPDGSDPAWVSDITYVRTYEGFLYLAVVLDLFSRQVVD